MVRRIIKIGNSDGITIPVRMMRVMKLKVGDQIEVVISETGGIAKNIELAQDLHKLIR
ncbi:MAG: hypothetical protein UX30_C0003G0060 [Candidatus Saccharibacteria bacterium GW2011_GWA2_46_10]|nr:MAG: hypothetical protein UX30_C0003G0060 [Candidatus Saccharibacteria bacterium GW2011_GWA2_46_10]